MDNKQILEAIDGWVTSGESQIKALTKLGREQVAPRKFKGAELVELLGIKNTQRIRDRETADKNFPCRERDSKGEVGPQSLDWALKAMKYFGTLPHRDSEIDDPVILAFTNFKGGCWKTTTSWYFSSWAGMTGLRILVADLDPQSTMTRDYGFMPDLETDYDSTMAALIMGEVEINKENVRAIVRKTHIPTVDLIPSSLDLQTVEWQLARALTDAGLQGDKATQVKLFLRVRQIIEQVQDDYDIIVIDGTPTAGLLPLNIVFASDAVIVPTPTEVGDFCSTVTFLKILRAHFKTLEEIFGNQFPLPEIQFMPTRYSTKSSTTMGSKMVLQDLIRKSFGNSVTSSVVQKHDGVVSNLGLLSRTPFDANVGEGNVRKQSWERAVENYSEVFREIMDKLVYSRWESKKQRLEMKGVLNG